MDARRILATRLRNQHLVGPQFPAPADAVRTLLAVQSQDFAGATWGLAQRVRGATDASIRAAYDEGDILRTHVMRPTWHFVTPDDIRWLLELTAPRVRKLLAHYDRGLEIDRKLLNRCRRILEKVLRDGTYRTRAELARAYAEAGIQAAGQRLAHINMHAELNAIICSGPMRGKQFTYALVDECAPNARALSRDEALAELALRYFIGHGPASVKDLAWWSGLTQAEARRAVEMQASSLTRMDFAGRELYTAGTTTGRMATAPHVRLLPNYDEYLIAYRDNDIALDAADSPRFSNDALAAHFIVIDGRVIGGWRRKLDGKSCTVAATLFRPLTTAEAAALDEEFERYSAFVGLPLSVTTH